jgi:hypothetical protein
MRKNHSYMNHRNLLSEGLLDDLINHFLPGMRDRAEQAYLKKKAKKLKKLEKDLEQVTQKKDAALDRFEKAFEKETGQSIDLKNTTLQQILDKY